MHEVTGPIYRFFFSSFLKYIKMNTYILSTFTHMAKTI